MAKMHARGDSRSPSGTGPKDESPELLAEAASEARDADRQLAIAMQRPAPSGATAGGDYLRELSRRPPLPRPTEQELIAAAKEGDREARARLVEAFMPLIGSVANLYRNSRQIQRIELMQEGVLGLLRALERYDPDYGGPFWAYASWWVRQAMQQLVAELTRPIVLSDRALRHLARLSDAHRQALDRDGREPGVKDLAEATGLDSDQVNQLLYASRPARSTEEPLAGEEGVIGSFGELLVDPLAEGEYEQVLSSIEVEQLRGLLSSLSERERQILRARFDLDGEGEQSLRQIGERLGLSAERVRQLEQRALGKLAAASRGSLQDAEGASAESKAAR